MSNSSVRTVVLFGIIAVILVGAAVGGVRLIKARNDSYASSQQKVAQTDTKQQPAQQPQPKKDTSSSSTQQPAQNTQNSSQSKTAVPPANTGTTPAPTSSTNTPAPTPKTTPSVAPQQDSHLPATSGFSPSEALPTITLMALAGIFGSKLLRARADYRRYIDS